MVQIDTDRPPFGERDARALVEAVVASDDRVEHHYLELKSEFDIASKRDQAKLAKFVLGAANRMPDKAATAFGGYAVMVIGVSHNAMNGIAPLEPLDIERAVKPFIGADGPHWDLARVGVKGTENEVLLLLVDPPKWGQPPFVCLKDGGERNELRDGAVYVRASGETREAKSDELAQLLKRGSAAILAAKVDVKVAGTVFAVDREGLDRVREDFIDQQRNRLLLALDLAKNPSPPATEPGGLRGVAGIAAVLASQGSMFGATSKPESRSEDEYRSEIIRWVQRVRDVWPEAMERFLGSSLTGVEVEVANKEDTFFEDAEVRVHLAGEVFGVPVSNADLDKGRSSIGIPAPPRPWGPTTVSILDAINAGAPPWFEDINPGGFTIGPSQSSWRNTGSIELEFGLDELRPRRSVRSDDLDVVLLAKDAGATSFEGTWEVTAKGHHAVYSGEVVVEVSMATELPGILRGLLGV